jgi:hypothetical protein
MKKALKVLLVLMVMALFSTSAYAASKQEIMDELRGFNGINGRTAPIPEKYLNVFADFLNGQDFTAAELDSMKAQAAEVKGIIEASGVGYFDQLDAATKDLLVSKAAAAARSIGATLVFDGDGISVIDRNGRKFGVGIRSEGYTVTDPDAPATPVVPSNPIKATGLSVDLTAMYIFLAAMALALAGMSVVVFKRRLACKF